MTDNARRAQLGNLGVVIPVALVVLGATLPVQADPEPDPGPLQVRVVSYNVWGLHAPFSEQREERIARIGPALLALKPDLVALQEVWVDADAARLIADLAAGGLAHAQFEGEGLAGSGLLIASRYPLQEARFRQFTIAGRPHHVWRGDYYARKGVLSARLETPLGGVTFADTHLHAQYGSRDYEPLQLTQALEVREALGNHGALILAGDINSKHDELGFQLLTRSARLTWPEGPFRIDWVLTRSGALSVRCLEARYLLTEEAPDLGRPLSDHPAMFALLELRRGKSDEPPPLAADATEILQAGASSLEQELDRSLRRTAFNVVVGLILIVLAGWGVGRGRRSERRWRRRGWFLVSVLLLGAAASSLGLALVHESHLRTGLSAARADLDRAF